MVFLNKKNLSFASFFALILCLHTGCSNDQIAPRNQSLAFVKYYGHVGEQKGSDLKRTIDGGYIMIGSTNSYSSEEESDMFIVKTDSLGNELWSTALGKASGSASVLISGTLGVKYVRYDEEGIKIAELPDGSGFIVTGNRTYVVYDTEFSPDKLIPEYKTKIVMYLIDAAGVSATVDGIELRNTTNFTEKVSDMKIDTTGGALKYVLTGYTTNVVITKPNSGIYDLEDIFTIVLDEVFTPLWSVGLLAYGFEGKDRGASIQILPDAYLVTGTSQEDKAPGEFYNRLISVRMSKANGTPLNTHFAGDDTYDMLGGYSVYDAINRRITIAGSVASHTFGTYTGQAVLYQLNEALVVQSTGTGNSFGLNYYRPTPKTTIPLANRNYYRPVALALLPENTGFVVSMTHEKTSTEYNVAIMKVDQDLALQDGWPYYFGYEDAVGSPFPTESAGAIIVVTEAITGTSQSTLKGYAFTGTFDIGTNDMIGLIKLNDDGTLNP